jgi:hypothetical protein
MVYAVGAAVVVSTTLARSTGCVNDIDSCLCMYSRFTRSTGIQSLIGTTINMCTYIPRMVHSAIRYM